VGWGTGDYNGDAMFKLPLLLAATCGTLTLPCVLRAQDQPGSVLPPTVKAVWDPTQAWRETTPTRERLSINGLWRWQPAADGVLEPPTTAWGYYKVPACWPGVQDYMQSDYQTLYPEPSWTNTNLAQVLSAWYERTITIPATWAGRRIALEAEYLNSFATIYIDHHQVGQLRFPAGQLDLSAAVRPGATHVLSVLVVAMPLKAVMESYNDTNTARQRQGRVERRGLCGDVWLISEPAGARLSGVRVATSVRQSQVTFEAQVRGLSTNGHYRLQARVLDQGQSVGEFAGAEFTALGVANGLASFSAAWKPAKLWDIHTPGNQFAAEVSLLDGEGRTVDAARPVQFGFREFWIQGRDFYLNGTRLYLSLVPLDNAQVGAALATYAAARESLLRLKSFGINFVYTHNYDCEPGSHLSFEEILRAADDTGMLVALSQPHFSAYSWRTPDAERTNGYANHAGFYVRVAGSHPSVVSYAMSHNATGYNEDMNPMMMDGQSNPRDQWSGRNASLALRCEAIVRQLDPARLVYHHSSGDLSAMYTLNFYPNFVPIQELDDWFEHWASAGNKPLLLVEYGAPFGWDWTMYRGWYKGRREFGSAVVPWEYCLAEWNAQFLGDAAYQISDREKRNLRWEAEQFRQGRAWHRWDYPYQVGEARLDEMQPVQAAYTTANWRAFRTWGLSGNSPWEHSRFWKLRDGFQPRRQELPVDWDHLQRPGYSPDYIDRTYARFDLAYERSDWIASPTAQSLIRNNLPVLAWIAGKPEHFTTKDHTFYPGETIEKQLIVLNNSRVTLAGDASWSSHFGPTVSGSQRLAIPTGEQAHVAIRIRLPTDLAPGSYLIKANFKASPGESQDDSFAVQVVPRPVPPRLVSKIAVFDPPGQTTKWLATLGITGQTIDAAADPSGFDVLVIGKGALTVDGPAPALQRVREGLKVVVFEQSPEVLERRLGFRVEAYGLRQVWPRVPDSPLLAGLQAENLRDWRGASTLLPPTLDYTLSPRYNGAPTVRWCGLEVTRLWRCGNWGNVASVLIEKPPRGDFLPVLDGGYALQYSPLLEYREGRGLILFCQMDVTARTEADPAAETLTDNILRYVDAWQPIPRRTAVYAGDPSGQAWLTACGVGAAPFKGQPPAADQVLVVGKSEGRQLAAELPAVAAWIKGGGRVLALGLDQEEANSFLPTPVTMQLAEHIATCFPPAGAHSLLAGIAPADVHNRDPRKLPLVVGGATVCGDGVLAATGNVVFCQLPPFQVSRTMGALSSVEGTEKGAGESEQSARTSVEPFNLRRTFARTSFAVSRLLGNLGVAGSTPLLERFGEPVGVSNGPSVIQDGDFSTDTNGDGLADQWELSANPPGASCTREALVGRGAGWAQLIAMPPLAPGARPPEIMIAQHDVPIRGAQWYRLTLRTKAEGLTAKEVHCTVQNTANWQALFDYQTLAPKSHWQTFSFDLKAKDTCAKGTKFQLWFTGTGKLWLAEARLEPIQDPTFGRALDGLYLTRPAEWDDPYRFFRW
jgi:beta-galactosidase